MEDVRLLHISHASTQRGCCETYEILKSYLRSYGKTHEILKSSHVLRE